MKLDAYNKIIWAVIGTGAILGFILVIALSLAGIFYSQTKGVRVEQARSLKPQGKVLVYYDPINLTQSPYTMIPVGFKVVPGSEAATGDRYNIGMACKRCISGSYSGYRGEFNNIVFRSKTDNSSFLLLDKKGVITSFYYPSHEQGEKDNKKDFNFLLFSIVEYDTSGDGVLNDRDADTVYLSNLSGKNLIKISPANTKLVDWNIDYDSQKAYLTLRRDSNNDKKFCQQKGTESLSRLKSNFVFPHHRIIKIGNIRTEIVMIVLDKFADTQI